MSSAPPRSIAVLCWAVIITIVAAIGVGHQLHDWAAAAAATTSAATGPGLDVQIAGRMAVAVNGYASTTDALRRQLRATLDRLAVRPVDRLAVATVVCELAGAAAAVRQLDADRPVIAAASSPRLRADAAALHGLYSTALLSATRRAALAKDLGYFGRLAATQGNPADSPGRRAVLAEAWRTAVAVTVATVTATAAFAVGFVLLGLLVVLFALGTFRFAYAVPAGIERLARPVWLEAFALWLVAFVAFSYGVGRLPLHPSIVASELMLAGVTAALAVGWPIWWAGLSVADVRRALGWHIGGGIVIEMACGLLGYVAGLPVVALGVVLTLFLSRLGGTHPSHPIQQDLGERMSAAHVLALLLAAAVLAPVLEETMFRGALYGHLRRQHRAWLSAAVAAVLFAAVHPQGWSAIPLLGGIAVELAFLREWRGSLIASMTAHAVNNAVVVVVLAAALG